MKMKKLKFHRNEMIRWQKWNGELAEMKWLDCRNIYYNNIGESEGSNKTSKFLANKISDKWDLKFKINHYF
jgi:hypothetical protein